MKKTLLFSLMAVLLAGFWFGGVSLADCEASAELNENEHVASITVNSTTKYYCSLADAIAAVGNEQTEIVLLKNLAESPVISGKNIILNLGSKTLTVDGWGLDVYWSILTVKNGIIEVTGDVGIYLNNANNFTLDSTAKIIGTMGSAITSDLYPEWATETNTVTISGEIDIENTAINLSNTSTLIVNEGAKIKGTDGIIISSKALSSNVTVNGYVEGSNVGVTINGNIISATECPTITIGSNAEIVTDGDETVGLYLAGYGKTTIADGAKMSGTASAIEIRAGELTVNGGTFTSTAKNFSITPNWNGSTTVWAAIAVSQHTTDSPINVVINWWTFDGVKALHEEDIQNEVATWDISISVTNGIFNGEVYSENVTKFIKWWIFTEKPDINYISDWYSVYKNNDSKYVVTTIEAAEQWAAEATITPDPVVTAETTFTTGAAEDFSVAIPAEDSSKTSVVEQKLPDVAGDSATYTLVVDTQETIEKVDESWDTTTTMTWVKESELRSSADKTPEIKWGAEVYIQKADWTITWRNVESVGFTKPVAIPISIWTDMAGKTVFVKVKHEMGESFWIDGLSNNWTSCTQVTSAPSLTVGANGYIIVYTCKASTFVAYTETGTTSSSTSSSSTSWWWGGGWGGSSSSYSCKSLPANAVANNTSKPKKDTNYSYSTDTGVVCTFQCKAGYTRNEKNEKCEKSSETLTDTDKEGTEKVDTTDTSDTAFEDLRKVLDDGYNVEFHNAYNFAFKNGITTMPNIQAADMNSPLTRIAMAKMLSQYAINVLKKTPDTTKTISFPDVSAELDAEYNNGVTLAYQLWIMWVNIENFRPDDLVTRAEFVTALSRMLFGLADWENLYYETHMQKLLDENIITVDNPNMHELRGYVMIMLMRSVKNN